MTIKIIDNDGYERIIPDAIAYDVLCEDDLNMVEEVLGITLTTVQREEVARRCRKAEYFPNMDDLRWIVKDVYYGG